MSFEFTDAKPIDRPSGAGRPAEPNPFTDVIKAIALKTTKVDGVDQPVAKSFVATHDKGDEARDKLVKKVKAQMSKAGEKNNPKVTVYVVAEPVKVGPKGREKDSDTQTNVTFWTVTRQIRTRKPKEEDTTATGTTGTETASTEQSTAVASA